MRVRTRLVVGFAGIALAAGGALPAAAASHHSAASHHASHASVTTKKFPITLTPHKNVKIGQTIHAVGRHALKNTGYDCVLIIDKGANYAADYSKIVGATSSKTGVVRCSEKFTSYSAKDLHGVTRHCPLTKADAKAGFSCAVAISTINMKSGNRAVFTAKGSK
jgi:hypothetical protein